MSRAGGWYLEDPTRKRAKALSEDERQKAALFNELMQECKHSVPGARLSQKLRSALERLSPSGRRELVSRTEEGCAPLFVASRRGNVELVEYLVHVCCAELEQRGVFAVPADRSVHVAPPLWAAAVAGRADAVRALADAGADLDACSDSGSTAVRSACFVSHVEVVRLLLRRGADLRRANHSGGTCLINAVQSPRLCALLLDHGADVDDRDYQLKTALHYAVQEHRVETARLLLDRGADPHLRSRAGDDALRAAALRGAAGAVALLVSRVAYPPARLADAYELLGATQLDELDDVGACLAAWRRATALRHAGARYLDKLPRRPPAAALAGAREWRSPDTLEELAGDAHALRTQALLVAERVLGADHRDTLARLMYRGAALAEEGRHRACADLWTWVLETRLARDSVLTADTCQTAGALTRLLGARGGWRGEEAAREAALARVLSLLAEALPAARRALGVRPVCRRQAGAFDRCLRCVAHLLHQVLEAGGGEERVRSLRRRVRSLLAADVRSALTGDTLLHLSVSGQTAVRSPYFPEEGGGGDVFPSAALARLLLECGADPRDTNHARSTPLHIAALTYNFSTEVVETLLAGGAHLDQPNQFGDSAAELLALNRASGVRLLPHLTLACLCARALARAAPPRPTAGLPRTLRAFLQLHCP